MMAGVMKMCLDNTFSHFSNKLVFFEIISDNDDNDVTASPFGQAAHEELQAIMDMTMDEFQVCLIFYCQTYYS